MFLLDEVDPVLFIAFVLTCVGCKYSKGEVVGGCAAALIWLTNDRVHLCIGMYHEFPFT